MDKPVEVKEVFCSNCGKPLGNSLRCSHCGSKYIRFENIPVEIPDDHHGCSDCGSPVENEDDFLCYECGLAYKKALIRGVGKDAPMVVNEHGGKQSKVEYAFDQLDPLAMFQLAGIIQKGAEKYGRGNWKKITTEEHLNHALQHIFAHLAGDKQDDHLGHAFCRLMFAIVVDRDGLT